MTATVDKPAETTAPVAKKKEQKFASDDIKYLVELAQQKEKEYQEAPDAFIEADTLDDHMALREIYAPETLDVIKGGKVVQKASRSAYIADKNKLKLAAQRGYVPVTDGAGELVVTPHGDVLCTIPQERSEAQQEAAAQISRDRLRKSEKVAASKSTLPGESVDASDVSVETTRTKIS